MLATRAHPARTPSVLVALVVAALLAAAASAPAAAPAQAAGDDDPTIAEMAFCALNLDACERAKALAGEATAASQARYPAWSLADGVGDAFRHCLWSGLMTMEWTRGEAKGYGDRHEERGVLPGETLVHHVEASFMDRHNNSWGREYASRPGATRESVAAECAAALEPGGILVVMAR